MRMRNLLLIVVLGFLIFPGAAMFSMPFSSSAIAAEKEKAPDFVLTDLEGKKVELSSLKGKVVLLNFWATWCPSCRAEMPSLNKLYEGLRSQGFEVVGISTDGSADEVKEYVKQKGLSFRIVMDDKREVSRKYRVFSLPTSFLIDKKGNVVEKFFGDYEWNDAPVKQKIEKLL